MVKTCCVYRCKNRADDKGKAKGISFFRFPKNKKKRLAWERAVNRKAWKSNENTTICSEHFINGWHGDEPDDDNYAPTIFSYKPKTTDVQREERTCKRELFKISQQEEIDRQEMIKKMENFSLFSHSYCLDSVIEEQTVAEGTVCETATQTDPDPLLVVNQQLQKELEEAKLEVERLKWGHRKIKDDDVATKFYTGLPTYAVFLWLYNYLSKKCTRMTYWTGSSTTDPVDRKRYHRGILDPIDQLFGVLVRLRLGLLVQDISERFNISIGTYSKYFNTWICLLDKELSALNPFPSRSIVNKHMPMSFKDKYPSTRIILDCTEIWTQRSSSLTNQTVTYSSYKNHNTWKFLVGITPSGVISFVSEAWGGRVSDRQITEESGVLDLLDAGDSVMADKGFTIADLLEKRNFTLNIPPFRGISNQFTTDEALTTREIAELRIHVERSIGRVKNFKILQGVIPLSLAPLISQLFHVCCWLTNFDTPIVDK